MHIDSSTIVYRRLWRLDRGDRACASEASSCELLARVESDTLRHGHSPAPAATCRHRTVQQHEHAELRHASRGALCNAQVDADVDAHADARSRMRRLERSPGDDVKRARRTPRRGRGRRRRLERGRGQGRERGEGKFSVRRRRVQQYGHHERDMPSPAVQRGAPDVRAALPAGRSISGGDGTGPCDAFAPARPASSRF